MKKCRMCGIEKDSSAFYRDRRSKDGLCGHCAECHRKKLRENFRTEPVEHKVCSSCLVDKPASAFHANGGRKSGLYSCCRSCASAKGKAWREKNPGYNRQYYVNNRDQIKHRDREIKYGITQTQFENLLKKQNNACAICCTSDPGGKDGQWNVDHSHTTNEIRGLLCMGCNMGVGMFKDSPKLLRDAACYLEKEPSGFIAVKRTRTRRKTIIHKSIADSD